MLTSKTFPSRQACLKSVNFFKTYSSIDSFYVKQNASCGSLYFTFNKGTNGEVLATSKSFLNEKNMGKIIMSIKASATSATIEDKIYKI